MATHAIPVGAALVAIDVCAAGCGGIWLDDADMRSGMKAGDDLRSVTIRPTLTPDTAQPVTCPICARSMQRYRWNYSSPVVLDQCSESHGTWIDHGEVQAMKQFVQSEAAVPVVPKKQAWAPLGERREVAADSLWEAGGWSLCDLLESLGENIGDCD